MIVMSHQISILQELEADIISAGALAYVGQRAKNSYYHYVMGKFREHEMTQAKLAKKIGKSPAQLNRTLATPSNWTIETIAFLLAGICGEEVTPASRSFSGRPQRNGLLRDPGANDKPDPLPFFEYRSNDRVNLVELKLENIE